MHPEDTIHSLSLCKSIRSVIGAKSCKHMEKVNGDKVMVELFVLDLSRN